jgi:hypothetical protein
LTFAAHRFRPTPANVSFALGGDSPLAQDAAGLAKLMNMISAQVLQGELYALQGVWAAVTAVYVAGVRDECLIQAVTTKGVIREATQAVIQAHPREKYLLEGKCLEILSLLYQ